MKNTEKSIDFARIREQCPKAFGRLIGHVEESVGSDMDTEVLCDLLRMYPRDLYDFFDAQGLQVYPLPVSATDWQVNIDENKTTLDSSQQHPTRTEAETAGFDRAFQILEQRL